MDIVTAMSVLSLWPKELVSLKDKGSKAGKSSLYSHLLRVCTALKGSLLICYTPISSLGAISRSLRAALEAALLPFRIEPIVTKPKFGAYIIHVYRNPGQQPGRHLRLIADVVDACSVLTDKDCM